MHKRNVVIGLMVATMLAGAFSPPILFAQPAAPQRVLPQPAAPEADEPFTCFVGVTKQTGEGETFSAIVGGALLCKQPDLRPVAWFGAHQPPGEKAKYLYLLLFKTPENFESQGDVAFSAAGATAGTGQECGMSITLGGKRIEVAYCFAADPAAPKVAGESLTLGGKQVLGEGQEDGPRVFVVDLTKESPEFVPVNVALPEETPDLASDNHDLWGAVLVRVTQKLRETSPELKRLLASEKSKP